MKNYLCMFRIMSKITLTFLMLLIFSVIFTGCENEVKPSLDNNFTDDMDLSPATLTFYWPGNERRDTKEVLDLVSKKSNLNIQLDFKWFSYDTYIARINAAIASNEKFDAFLCGRPENGSISFIDMFRKGYTKDVTSLLPKYAPNILKQLSLYDELDCIKVDGKICTIPNLCPQAKILSVAINQYYISNYNLPPIKSLEDYGLVMKIIKDNDPNIIPGSFGPYNIEFLAGAYGYVILDYSLNLVYKWDDQVMKIIPWEQTPEFLQTATFVNKWSENGYIKPGSVQIDKQASFLFLNNIFTDGHMNINNNKYTVFRLHQDEKIQRASPIGSIYTNGAITFTERSKSTERVLTLLDWIQKSQENYDLFMYGIIDKDYVIKGEFIDLPKGILSNESPYMNWRNNAFVNLNLERINAQSWAKDSFSKEDHLENINSKTLYAPHEGFYPDYETVKDEYNNRKNLINQRIINPLSNNTFDINRTESIIKEIKNDGTDKIVSVIQNQLDKWRSVEK